MFLRPVTEEEICTIISGLRDSAAGWDEIPAKILKRCMQFIVVPITHVCNLSLFNGIFPSELKTAMIVPIFKAGDPTLVNNYRPVSVLPSISKIFEKIMYNRLIDFVEHSNLLYDFQFGFRKGRSTSMAITQIIDKITQALDNGEIALGVFLDFSKAFDTVNFNILFKKLEKYGIRGKALDWFKSYLADRKQYVKFENIKSTTLSIKCGVPQGSILGPLLFLLYINDIEAVSKKLFLILFADDSSAFISGKDLTEITLSMNIELKQISIWLQANKLSINIGKTHFMIFSSRNRKIYRPLVPLIMNGEVLEEVFCTKFLGVLIDSKLNWNCHIQYIKKKIAKGVGILCKARKILTDETMITLYYAFVYPYLQYAVEIWGNTFNCYLDGILKLQKRAVRTICYAKWREHSGPLFHKLKLLPIKQVYVFKIAQFMYKFDNSMLPNIFNNMFTIYRSCYNTRSKNCNFYKTPKHRLVVRAQFISVTGPKIWNHLNKILPQLPSLEIKSTLDGQRTVTQTCQNLTSLCAYKRVVKEYLNVNEYTV